MRHAANSKSASSFSAVLAGFFVIVTVAVACGSGGAKSGGNMNSTGCGECDDDQVCGADGRCHTASSPDAGTGGAASTKNGDPCVSKGSNCDPTCLESCGASSSCVNLCCPETSSAGILCDGQCVAPKCKQGEISPVWETFSMRAWTCYQVTVGGATACDCTNSSTPAELMAGGMTIVPTCDGAFCKFELDAPDLDCRCRATGTRTTGVCSNVCTAVVPSCTKAISFGCDDPCVGFSFKQ